MSSSRNGKTSGISTVAIVIVAVVVIAGLGAGIFFVLPQMQSQTSSSSSPSGTRGSAPQPTSEMTPLDLYGISISHPDSLIFTIGTSTAPLSVPLSGDGGSYKQGAVAFNEVGTARVPKLIVMLSWSTTSKLDGTQINEALANSELLSRKLLTDPPGFRDMNLGTMSDFDFQGRPATMRDGISFVVSGEQREAFLASWYDAGTDRVFQYIAFYSESESSVAHAMFDSIKMST